MKKYSPVLSAILGFILLAVLVYAQQPVQLRKSDGSEVTYIGQVAHDAGAGSVDPLLTGCYASAAAPADVSADADATREWCLRNGARAIQPTFAGVLQSTGTGASGTGVPRVTVSNDSSLAANQSVNVNQKGGAAVHADPCEREATSFIVIDQTAGEQLATGTASERIYICSLNLVTATAQNIALVSGTGTVCATSTGPMMGGTTAATGWNFGANGGIVLPAAGKKYSQTDTDADNVCLLQSGAGQVSGSMTYVSAANGL